MAEQRRIPQVERLEVRDMPAVLGVPVLAPPIHLAPAHADVAPQVALLAPATPSVAGESSVTRDVASPIAGSDNNHPLVAVWQQPADAIFGDVGEHSDSATTDAPPCDTATDSLTAPTQEAPSAVDSMMTAPQPAPTMTGVLRYAWKSVNRHRVDDRDDVVQQVGLEWLLLAATIQTTYDDVRRIVSRVLNRAYRRLKKQERALELLDVPTNADPVQDAFRDIQLDCDLGVNDLTDRQWQVVRLRRQGYSFTEIGQQMGIPRQRACELFAAAASRLRERYREAV
jgi:DNA-binding NarL/FixJ family response regulator